MFQPKPFFDLKEPDIENMINKIENVNQEFLLLVEKFAEGVMIIDKDGFVRFANQSSKSFFQEGKDGLIDKLFEFSLESNKFIEVEITRNSGESGIGEMQSFEIKIENKICHLVTVRDITEQKLLEAKLSKSDRLNSIGVIAGGIAHDFNNLVTVILGYVSMVKFDIKGDPDISKKLTMVEKASLEAKNLAQQLLTFSKGGCHIKKSVSIIETLKNSTDFALRGSTVECHYYISEDLWPVEIDEGQMNQVFTNLIINSRQAIQEAGVVNIKAENIIIENELKENGSVFHAGKHIKISIQDNGTGIPEKYINKIFDPYFTSKQNGNGLGLATIDSIIKKHEGLISVKSKEGVGTTFHIYLPASVKAAERKASEISEIVKGKGRILVMDDDISIRTIAEQSLSSIGYDVSLAEEGVEVIEAYKKAKDTQEPFSVVIIDLTIKGGMGGEETISELLKIDPDVKAIVSSGYANNPVMANYKIYGFKISMAKPYSIETLSKIINDVIMDEQSDNEQHQNQQLIQPVKVRTTGNQTELSTKKPELINVPATLFMNSRHQGI